MEEIGDCLKDETQHEKPTEISSECTDFMALNSACKEDISTHCDDAFFSDDTAPCLSKWTDQEQIGSKCASVMKWAIAQPEDEEQEDGPTDELGMSDADRAEKAEWQKNRKAIREEAIGRMKMKEIDRKKEEDRVALLKFKEDDPEGYAEMIRQQEEEKRQQAEFKRQERIRAAAYQRKFNDEEVETAQPKKKKGSFMKSAKWFVLGALKVGVFVAILGGIAYVVKAAGSGGAAKRGGGSGKGSKKRR
jgi:hypothetical protein